MSKQQPRFRTEGKPPHVKVMLGCSSCQNDIREIGMAEEIDITRGYYCKDCGENIIPLNSPINGEQP